MLVEKFVVKDLRLEKKLPITAPVIDFCFQIRVFRDMKSLIVHKEDGNRDSAVRNFFSFQGHTSSRVFRSDGGKY